jgi:hypothetical protein
MAEIVDALPSIEPEITPLLHISTWDFGIMHGLLTFLSAGKLIDQYDLDEMISFYHKLVPNIQGPDRFCMHYRLYDEALAGKFSVEDRVVGTSYDYRHTVRGEAIEAAIAFSTMNTPRRD